MSLIRQHKVLITLNNNKLSGIERFAILIADFIDKNQFDITFALPSRGNLCDLLDQKSIKYFIFNKPGKKPYSAGGIRKLFLHLLKNRYDIIHAQAGIVPCLLGKLLNVKLIIEHKHGLDFTHEERDNISVLKIFYESRKKYFTDFTLTGCESDRNYLISKFGYKRSKVITLYNGIEKDINQVGKYNPEKGTYVIGTIGRLTYQKGQEYFIEMANILKNEITGKTLRFEIWGDGENRNLYENLIYKYKLQNMVLLMGYAQEWTKVYTNFDVFVLPSRYEGIPYVILEAMRAKVPVISANVGGISEIIRNNVNGLLVEKENAELLAESVKRLLFDYDLRERLTEQAYIDLNDKYLIQNTITKLSDIYRSINIDT